MGSEEVFLLGQELRLRALLGAEGEWLPPTDVYETEEAFIVLMELPGMEPEGIKVSFTEGVLMIRGERREEPQPSRPRYHQMEIRYGPFQREIYFHVPIAKEKIQAQYRQGLLKVVLPKR